MTKPTSHRPITAICLALLMAAAPSGLIAAEKSAKEEGAGKAKGAKDGAPDSVDVDLPAIFAPMISGGQLTAYAYLTVSLTPATPAKALDIRAKVPFLQDAILREVNGQSIVKAEDAKQVDVDMLKVRLMKRVAGVLPAGTVTDIKFEQVVIAPLRSQD
jgi:hypothetical protein